MYRKKPVIVDAMQFIGPASYDKMVKHWPEFGGKSKYSYCYMAGINRITIKTKKGYLAASIGDYVIKNNKGEFYPCKPDIFGEIYESVEAECYE